VWPRQHRPKGICAFSYNGESIYVVNEIEPCKVLVCNEAIGKMTEFLEGENVKTVCYDSKHLYKSLEINGIHIDNFGFDVMLGAYVLDPAGNFDLSRLVARYMNEVFSEDIPEAYYAMAIYKEIAPIVEEREQHGLLFDIEMPLARVLADMEMAGFRVDIEGLKNYGDQLGKLEKEAEERIYCYAGEEFNVNSPKQLGEVLFEKLMLPSPGKKTKTGYSTNAEVLEKMHPYYPIIM
jgi:DNA polymerase-1